jgi:hypothetical protein
MQHEFTKDQLVIMRWFQQPYTRKIVSRDGNYAWTKYWSPRHGFWQDERVLYEELIPLNNKYNAGQTVLLKTGQIFTLPIPTISFGQIYYGEHIRQRDIVSPFCR